MNVKLTPIQKAVLALTLNGSARKADESGDTLMYNMYLGLIVSLKLEEI